jgi:hypothetical protein
VAASFNLDAFRAAHRPWSFQVGGFTFEARHVSARQVLRYEDRVRAAGKDERKLLSAVTWLLRRAFPFRPSYFWRGDPVGAILRLEPAARRAALADFFSRLRGETRETPRQETDGTPSSPRRTTTLPA